ncbi:DUF2744 domain-containing protein [Corynebacterium callunae]|uniref:phage gene 29 protein family protein n=1 Tax=Corynebacterium callunae TaxID=1721 RepID=UPI0039828425
MSNGIPLQSECDASSPEEHALWALVGLPGPGKNAPLMMPPPALREISQHLWECGFRHDPDLQKKKYVPPRSASNWIACGAGRWVPINTVLPAEDTVPDLSSWSVEEKRALLANLQSELQAETPNSQEDRAEVHDG